jgi:hypothetical protein
VLDTIRFGNLAIRLPGLFPAADQLQVSDDGLAMLLRLLRSRERSNFTTRARRSAPVSSFCCRQRLNFAATSGVMPA